MEAELQALRKKEAAAAAAKDAEVQAAQQLLDDMFQRAEKQRSEAVAAAQAGRETDDDSEDLDLQQQQRKQKPSIEDEVRNVGLGLWSTQPPMAHTFLAYTLVNHAWSCCWAGRMPTVVSRSTAMHTALMPCCISQDFHSCPD
jgi:hypothetical protein